MQSVTYDRGHFPGPDVVTAFSLDSRDLHIFSNIANKLSDQTEFSTEKTPEPTRAIVQGLFNSLRGRVTVIRAGTTGYISTILSRDTEDEARHLIFVPGKLFVWVHRVTDIKDNTTLPDFAKAVISENPISCGITVSVRDGQFIVRKKVALGIGEEISMCSLDSHPVIQKQKMQPGAMHSPKPRRAEVSGQSPKEGAPAPGLESSDLKLSKGSVWKPVSKEEPQ